MECSECYTKINEDNGIIAGCLNGEIYYFHPKCWEETEQENTDWDEIHEVYPTIKI